MSRTFSRRRVDPNDPTHYMYKGQSLPFAVRHETIHVSGGPDVELDVRSTVHGVGHERRGRHVQGGRPRRQRRGPGQASSMRLPGPRPRNRTGRWTPCWASIAHRIGTSSGRRSRTLARRRRRSCTPTSTATSASRSRASSRSARQATAHTPFPARTARTTGRATCRSTSCPTCTTLRAA